MKYFAVVILMIISQHCAAQNAQDYSKLLGVLYNINHSDESAEVRHQKDYEAMREFITTHPANTDVFLLISEAEDFHAWQLDSLMALTDSSIGNSHARSEALNTMHRVSVAETGKAFPGYVFTDTLKHSFAVSNLKGKYVLIDLWASFCRPCRMEMPALKKVYEKYKEKNFEIIGVSFDNNKRQWLTAVRSDGLSWPQYCELVIWNNNKFSKKFYINSLPSNFLLDKNGIIIGQNLSAEQLEEILSKQ